MTRVGWGVGGRGEEEATQFSFVTTLPPDRGYRRSSIHMSVYLSIALDVSERPPPGLRHLFHPHKNWQWYGLALVSWAAAFGRMYILYNTCVAERIYIFFQFQTVSSLKIDVCRKVQTFLYVVFNFVFSLCCNGNRQHKQLLDTKKHWC